MKPAPRQFPDGTARRDIPAVERVLQALGEVALPRPMVLRVVREELARWRTARAVPGFDAVVAGVRGALDAVRCAALRPVINATGVILHTNLGRAPLGPAAVEALTALASNYTNLELDLGSGERGGRAAYVERLLAVLCGAEAAVVVNNCAAALVLILRHFTGGARPEVLISRGELIQIGGGFRIPEVLESSGARLREVGTTNRTTLSDYAAAVGTGTALILKVHRSNFFMEGFVDAPSTEALADLARRKRIPLVEDLGSGALVDTDRFGVGREPTPAEVLRRGVGLVCFSGDKLLGGPQAGVIAGKQRWVAALKREPFFRALRCDKLILGALQATAESYLRAADARSASADGADGSSLDRAVPVVAMLQADASSLRARAEALRCALEGLPVTLTVAAGKGQVGGGALPRATLPSVTLDLAPHRMKPAELVARLRAGSTPVVALLSAGRVRLDLRTVFPRQDVVLAELVRAALGGGADAAAPAGASPGCR